MARPIPRAMLPHEATHKYGIQTDDGWGNKAHHSSQTLKFVRFEPSSKLVMTKDNNEVQLSAVMFFDCKNSTPVDAIFTAGDLLNRTGGAAYTIVGGVEPICAKNSAHHYELELV